MDVDDRAQGVGAQQSQAGLRQQRDALAGHERKASGLARLGGVGRKDFVGDAPSLQDPEDQESEQDMEGA